MQISKLLPFKRAWLKNEMLSTMLRSFSIYRSISLLAKPTVFHQNRDRLCLRKFPRSRNLLNCSKLK